MRGFEYGNTRLRGMKARLLSASDLDRLAAEGDLDAVSNYLADTEYVGAIEVGLAYGEGQEAIMYALREDMQRVITKIKGFYNGEIHEMVMLSLREHDIFNLKTILRGLDAGLPFESVRRSLIPVGELSIPLLEELARASDAREAIDRLATFRIDYARPLVNLRREKPGAEIFEMEIALSQWHYKDAQRRLSRAPKRFQLMREALAIDVDIANIMTCLRFAATDFESEELQKHMQGYDDLWPFIPAGRLEIDLLRSASETGDVADAIEILAIPPYQTALLSGFEDYQRSGRLSEVESALMAYRLRWRTSLMLDDPLGIGVFLAYVAMKVNEIQNIRRITLGIELGLAPEDIREWMVLPA